MSFLQQLKNQASDLQSRQGQAVQHLDANVAATEDACQTVWHYLSELAAQLNVIQPASRDISLDGKTKWPVMKLADFRFDARKKILRQREVTEHLALGWRIVPTDPTSDRGSVSVNFPPELERVETRLRAGQVKHERLEQRHPDSHKLLAVVFEHDLAARGGVVFTPDHDQARFRLRLLCVNGLVASQSTVSASQISVAWLDDLAKAVVGQPSSWG
ncbi:MAG: hypothetical protein K2W33_06925 [Burkholderiales bacterium]|nr:hypothetical protein [Burkholderiales bacterium]